MSVEPLPLIQFFVGGKSLLQYCIQIFLTKSARQKELKYVFIHSYVFLSMQIFLLTNRKSLPSPRKLTCRWYLRGGGSGNGSFVALIFHRISFISCVFKLFLLISFFNNFFSQIYTSYRATSTFSGCFQQTTFLTRWNSTISIFANIDGLSLNIAR